jgi:cathepsin L
MQIKTALLLTILLFVVFSSNLDHLTKVGVDLPDSVDWRKQKKVTPAKDQIDHTIDGWAYAVTSLYESFLLIGGQSLNNKNLSTQYVSECTPSATISTNSGQCDTPIPLPDGDSSTPPLSKAVLYVWSYGLPNVSDYKNTQPVTCPASGSTTPPPIPDPCGKIKNYTYLDGDFNPSASNIDDTQMKQHLVNGPVVARINATGLGNYNLNSPPFSCIPDPSATVPLLNHTVLVVGYDTDGNYIIRNSYGSLWGKGGDAIIDQTNDCGLKT